MSLFRVIGIAVLAGLAVGVYFLIDDRIEANREMKYRKYAGVITETSIAAELYRNKRDSFLVVRDSIMHKYGVSSDEMLKLQDRFADKPEELVTFWKFVSEMTDSAVKIQDSILRINGKLDTTARDSAK
jgi:hypothetical protein